MDINNISRGQVVRLNKSVQFDLLGQNIQSKNESKNGRLFLIVSNDINNKGKSPIVNVVSLTTKTSKSKYPMHAYISSKKYKFLEDDNLALAEQIFTINKDKIDRIYGSLNEYDMKNVARAITVQFACLV